MSRLFPSLRRQSVAVQAGPPRPLQQQPLDPRRKLSSARVVMAGALEIGANGGCRQSRRRPMRGDRRGAMRWRRSRHRRCSACAQPSLDRPADWRKYPPFPGPARPPRIVLDGAKARFSDVPPIQPCTLRTTLPQLSEKRPPCAARSCGAGRSPCVDHP